MKIIEVIADASYQDIVTTIGEQHEARDCWVGPKGEDGRCIVRLLVGDSKRQEVLDALQGTLSNSPTAKILVTAVEAALPREEAPENDEAKKKAGSTTATTREELYNSIEKNARLNSTYVILVVLSTIVVAIGLLKDNVAVVIGAAGIFKLLQVGKNRRDWKKFNEEQLKRRWNTDENILYTGTKVAGPTPGRAWAALGAPRRRRARPRRGRCAA